MSSETPVPVTPPKKADDENPLLMKASASTTESSSISISNNPDDEDDSLTSSASSTSIYDDVINGNSSSVLPQQRKSCIRRRGAASSRRKMEHRRVSFDRLSVREYQVTLGDHPSTEQGPPLTLSWNVQAHYEVSVEEYETLLPRPRRTGLALKVPASVRHRLLQKSHHSAGEIAQARRQVDRVRHQRRLTIAMQEFEHLEIAWQSAARKLKRWWRNNHHKILSQKRNNNNNNNNKPLEPAAVWLEEQKKKQQKLASKRNNNRALRRSQTDPLDATTTTKTVRTAEQLSSSFSSWKCEEEDKTAADTKDVARKDIIEAKSRLQKRKCSKQPTKDSSSNPMPMSHVALLEQRVKSHKKAFSY